MLYFLAAAAISSGVLGNPPGSISFETPEAETHNYIIFIYKDYKMTTKAKGWIHRVVSDWVCIAALATVARQGYVDIRANASQSKSIIKAYCSDINGKINKNLTCSACRQQPWNTRYPCFWKGPDPPLKANTGHFLTLAALRYKWNAHVRVNLWVAKRGKWLYKKQMYSAAIK